MNARFWRWLIPGLRVKRYLLLIVTGLLLLAVGFSGTVHHLLAGWRQPIFWLRFQALLGHGRVGAFWSGVAFLLGLGLTVLGIERLGRTFGEGLRSRIRRNLGDHYYRDRHLERGPRVVVIGGGTGLSVLLRGLKNYTAHITAVVAVSDDGGSSGRLRDDLGILPPGDIRNCLLALAEAEPLMRRLFRHRFSAGDLAGHSFGNLFIAAMSELTGDFEEAVRQSSEVLNVRGQVLPVTPENVTLVAVLEDGRRVEGETRIAAAGGRIREVSLLPDRPRPSSGVLEAIREADAVILGPGSLYSSILPNLLVRGIPEVLRASKAKKFFVTNMMTQAGETDNYTAADHLRALVAHSGLGTVDYVVINTGEIPEQVRRRYQSERAQPVDPSLAALEAMGIRVIRGNFIAATQAAHHDPNRLARAILWEVWRDRTFGRRHRLDHYLLGERLRSTEERGHGLR